MSITINYHGFFDGHFGIAEATRLNAMALESQGIKVNKINYNPHEHIRETKEIPDSDINIFHVNINIIADFFANNSDLNIRGKYNILYWAWEFPEVEEEKVNILNSFDELWVPSDFCVNIFNEYTSIPVRKMVHPVQTVNINNTFKKREYNISEDVTIFLTIFDSLSTTIRKNPEATINAFINAFKNDDQHILIVKTFNVEKNKSAQKILEKYKDIPNIIIISEHFSKEKLHSIIQQSDVLISLHGSEGFGFTMAEAMNYGKIVVGTGYSGNLEFMNVNNSFLVQYDFIQTSDTQGLLAEGLTLAKPKIQDATEKLIYIKNNFGKLDEMREKAKKEIEHNFSIEKVGITMKKRLSYIQSIDKNSRMNNPENSQLVFYMAEVKVLKRRIEYLERTIYNKIRKKVNTFFKKLRNKS